MLIKNIYKDIYYIEDFFSQFDILSIEIDKIVFHDRPKEDNRYAHDIYQPKYYMREFHEMSKSCDEITSLLLTEINTCIYNIYNYKLKDCSFNAIQYTKNQGMAAHSDNNLEPNKFIVSSVYYPNDNYSGGELLFNDLNIKIKPKKNSLVLFDSNYKHQALIVEDGIKTSCTNFWEKN